MRFKSTPNQEYLAQCFAYDSQTGDLRWRCRPVAHFSDPAIADAWNAKHGGTLVDGRNSRGYRVCRVDGERFLAHRLIWKMLTGVDTEEIDHIDGNPLNNGKTNLRPASRTQNCANRSAASRSHPRGVYERNGRFRAIFISAGVRTSLGTFPTQELAHAAWFNAASASRGEFFTLRERAA